MYNSKNLKDRILTAKCLYRLFGKPGDRKHGYKYVYEKHAIHHMSVSYETFVKYCKNTTYMEPEEMIPLQTEASFRCESNFTPYSRKLENREMHIWEIPHTPENEPLIESYRARQQLLLDKLEAERQKAGGGRKSRHEKSLREAGRREELQREETRREQALQQIARRERLRRGHRDIEEIRETELPNTAAEKSPVEML